jgi:hypothetical protein
MNISRVAWADPADHTTSPEKLSGQKYGTDILRWRQWYEAHGKE